MNAYLASILHPRDAFPDTHQNHSGDHTLFPSTPSGTLPGPADEDVDPLEPNYIVFSITLILVIVGVIGNLAVITIFSSTPKLRNQTGICMISLSIADFQIGVFYLCVSLPCSLHGECLIMTNRLICLSAVIISYTSYGAAFLTLAVVSINRALLISRPIRYRTILTTKRMFLILIALWIVAWSIVLGFILSRPHIIQFDPAYFNCGLAAYMRDAWPYAYVINILGFLIPVIITIACSVKIVLVTRDASRRVRHQAAEPSVRGSLRRNRRPTSSRGSRSDLEVTMRLAVVAVAFIVCFLPYQIQLVYARYTGEMYPSTASLISVMLLWFDSAVNPMIIAFTYSNFRNVLGAKLTRFFSLRRRSTVEQTKTKNDDRTTDQPISSSTTNTTSFKSTSNNKSFKKEAMVATFEEALSERKLEHDVEST